MSRTAKDKKEKIIREEIFYLLRDFRKISADKLLTRESSKGRTLDPKIARFYEPIDLEKGLKPKPFVGKGGSIISQPFANNLLRILGIDGDKKTFSGKKIISLKHEDGASRPLPEILIKWDTSAKHISRNLRGQYLVTPYLEIFDIDIIAKTLRDTGLEEFQHLAKGELIYAFLANYARLCGALLVLGELDSNQMNIMISAKTGLPLKIDNTMLIHGSGATIFGSSFSNEFLCMILGEETGFNCDSRNFIDVRFRELHSTLNEEPFGQNDFVDTLLTSCQRGIDILLFKKIQRNIADNPKLKILYLAMMQGVHDAIQLAGDEEFMAQYVAKFDQNPAQAEALAAAFKENAARAKEEYASFLQHFEELKSTENREYEISPQNFNLLLERDAAKLEKELEKIKSQEKTFTEAKKLSAKFSQKNWHDSYYDDEDKIRLYNLHSKWKTCEPSYNKITALVDAERFLVHERKAVEEKITILREKISAMPSVAPKQASAVAQQESVAAQSL